MIVPDGDKSADALARNAHAIDFVREQYRHCKPILVLGGGADLLVKAMIPPALPDGSPTRRCWSTAAWTPSRKRWPATARSRARPIRRWCKQKSRPAKTGRSGLRARLAGRFSYLLRLDGLVGQRILDGVVGRHCEQAGGRFLALQARCADTYLAAARVAVLGIHGHLQVRRIPGFVETTMGLRLPISPAGIS
jgi:hypothetical protein